MKKIPTAEFGNQMVINYICFMDKKEYESIHKWIRRNYGKATKCEHCPNPSKRYDWALKKGYEYKRDISYFMQLCRSCHVKYDFTEERANKISKLQLGINNNFYGKVFTEDMKAKQREKKNCKVIISENTETGEILISESITVAASKLNLHKSNIIAFLKGRYNGTTYKNWKFTYG